MVTLDPDFKVTVLLKANISKTVRVGDKVSIEH